MSRLAMTGSARLLYNVNNQIYSQAALRQFVHGMNTTTPETLIKIGESYPDMTIQEKVLNGYIEMLKIDQVILYFL